jgi:hypothetical protein
MGRQELRRQRRRQRGARCNGRANARIVLGEPDVAARVVLV